MKSSVKVKDSGKTVCPNSVRWCEFSFPNFPLTDLKSIVGTPFAYSGKINGEVICLFSITSILFTYFEIFSPGIMFPAFTSVQISIMKNNKLLTSNIYQTNLQIDPVRVSYHRDYDVRLF